MKITKEQLKQFIKQEYQAVLSERELEEDLAGDTGSAYGLVDAALAQAERWANELVGIDEYIQDPDVKGIAEQSVMELNGALKEVSAALQKLIAAVDANLQEGNNSD